MSSQDSSEHPGDARTWIVSATVLFACLGMSLWAIPQLIGAHNLAAGAQTSYSVEPAITAEPVQATGSIDSATLTKSLKNIAEDFSSGNLTGLVVDAAGGNTLYSNGADKTRIPASNFKLLTDYTLVRTVDPYARYTTEVVQSGNTITLVAGGDTLLGTGESSDSAVVGHAGLQTLANRTYEALKKQGGGRYTLNLDTSIYSGAATNSAWSQEDIDAQEVGALSPVAFYSHYSPGNNGKASSTRPADAAAQVQKYLLDALNTLGTSDGISLTLGSETEAEADARVLGSVESATVAEQAAYMMQNSDNMLAEALGRNASVATGGDGSFESAKSLILKTLAHDGISTESLTMVDLCGLSSDNRVTNTTLADIMRAMVNGKNGTGVALDGFPVAGGSGTLETRFDDENEQAAVGYARAKTGTLNAVISLTGYTVTESGHILVFSFITNDVTDVSAAKNTLDESVAVIRQQ